MCRGVFVCVCVCVCAHACCVCIKNKSHVYFYVISGVADPPSNLSVTQVSPTSIIVSWTAPSPGATVTGYRMYYRAVADQGNTDLLANETEHILLGLQCGLSYTITMLTKSHHLPSHLSSSVRATLGMAIKILCTSLCSMLLVIFPNLFAVVLSVRLSHIYVKSVRLTYT